MNKIAKPKKIKPKDAVQLVSKDGAFLVDVRTPQEFREAHIPGALSLPLDKLSSLAEKALPDKEEAVILYCLSGARSRAAAKLLAQMGYQNIRNLGGMHRWPYGIK
jgi:rhodanese-related sulfurtransferase